MCSLREQSLRRALQVMPGVMPLIDRTSNFDQDTNGRSTDSLRWWETEVLAGLLGEVVVDLRVPRNAGCSAGGTDIDRMISTFPEQPATVLLQVVDQRGPLRALVLSGSRMTGPFPVVC